VEKLVYCVWQERGASIEPLRERLFAKAAPELLARSRGPVTLHVADVPGGFTSDRSGPALGAVASCWLDSVDQRASLEGPLREVSPELTGYLVTESVPLEYARRDWPDGTRSPGITVMAMFERPAWLEPDEFIRRWHGSHTPKSLEIHPLRRYVRNVVARVLTPGARPFAGIVPEAFDTLQDFTDPRRLYGGGHEKYGGYEATLRVMVEDQKSFLDLANVHVTIVSETILRSAWE
jgi:hypothetical protein